MAKFGKYIKTVCKEKWKKLNSLIIKIVII